ncbi:MAG: hypothetical protein QXU60_05570 [Sulfolobales archaeon]
MSESKCSGSVRVRGVYSTALASILLEKGYCLSDVSEKIYRRVEGLNIISDKPPDTTIKNDDTFRDILVIVGVPETTRRIYEDLRSILKNSFFTDLKPLNAVYRGRVDSKISQNECHVSTPLGVKGVLRDPTCYPGQVLDLTIIGYGDDLKTPLVRRGVSVAGRYMILSDSGVVQFSEHIRDPDVLEVLKGFSEIISREGFGVRWRSSAKNSTTSDLMQEYDLLKNKISEIKKILERSGEEEFAYVSESIAFIHVSSEDMITLDSYRSKLHPTTPYHHVMRSYTFLGDLIDLLDSISGEGAGKEIFRGFTRFLRDKMLEGLEVFLYHRRPFFSREIVIGPARALYSDYTERSGREFIRVILGRISKGEGVYDGLEIPKEPGDRIITLVSGLSPLIVHAYYSSSLDLKGVYINANTLPHITYDLDLRSLRGRIKIVYSDLYIDAVITRDGGRIIDEEEFKEACDRGFFSERLCINTRSTLERVSRESREIYSFLEGDMARMIRENTFTRDSVERLFSFIEVPLNGSE